VHLVDGFIARSLKTHLGPSVFRGLGPVYEPLLQGAAVLAVLWLVLFWMYRRRLFLKV
jgi:predicted acyltransferase